jgi:signal peptidase I
MNKYPVQVLLREYFEGILAALFLALFLRFFVISILYIPTENMEPNLKKGDFVISWRMVYGFPLPLMRGERLNFKSPQYGDVISFRFPGDEEQTIIRRVIGLPGDEIEIKEGQIFINKRPIPVTKTSQNMSQESYLSGKKTFVIASNKVNLDKIIVPEANIFVLSDNRIKTDDSRDWGFVPFNNIESRLGLIWLSVDTRKSGFNINKDRLFKGVN